MDRSGYTIKSKQKATATESSERIPKKNSLVRFTQNETYNSEEPTTREMNDDDTETQNTLGDDQSE